MTKILMGIIAIKKIVRYLERNGLFATKASCHNKHLSLILPSHETQDILKPSALVTSHLAAPLRTSMLKVSQDVVEELTRMTG